MKSYLNKYNSSVAVLSTINPSLTKTQHHYKDFLKCSDKIKTLLYVHLSLICMHTNSHRLCVFRKSMDFVNLHLIQPKLRACMSFFLAHQNAITAIICSFFCQRIMKSSLKRPINHNTVNAVASTIVRPGQRLALMVAPHLFLLMSTSLLYFCVLVPHVCDILDC